MTNEQEQMWKRLKEPAVKPEVAFSLDGKMMAITQPDSLKSVFYHLSTPWDITTASRA